MNKRQRFFEEREAAAIRARKGLSCNSNRKYFNDWVREEENAIILAAAHRRRVTLEFGRPFGW